MSASTSQPTSEFILATLARHEPWDRETVLLAASLRDFGGSFATCPMWVLVPEGQDHLSDANADRLRQLQVSIHKFQPDTAGQGFPFAVKVSAAAAAEAQAAGQCTQLVWMDSDTLVLNPPHEFLLPAGVQLGVRPVHHTLIGSPAAAPPDDFWSAIYQACNVPPQRLFPVTTDIDRVKIRPYFNAGLLVTRPEAGLLRDWLQTFFRVFQQDQFQPFFKINQLYRIFFHQAVLAGVILAKLKPAQIVLLPPQVNYPLHLWQQQPANERPAQVEELTSLRYDTLLENSEWRKWIPAGDKLLNWLDQHLAEF